MDKDGLCFIVLAGKYGLVGGRLQVVVGMGRCGGGR